MKRKPLILLSLVLIVAVSIAVVAYILLPKQSDGDYEALHQSISKVKDSEELVSLDVSSFGFPMLITEESTSRYSEHVSDLSKAIKSLDENPVLAKDAKVKDAYNTYKDAMQSYITSNTNLLSSIKSYATVSSACSDMGYSLDQIRSKGSPMTTAAFTTSSKECKAAIDASDSAPDAQFNDQFFVTYLSEINALVGAYQQEFSTGNNTTTKKTARETIEKTWSDILSMNNNSLVLTRSPDPSEALNKLEEVVKAQKANAFR